MGDDYSGMQARSYGLKVDKVDFVKEYRDEV